MGPTIITVTPAPIYLRFENIEIVHDHNCKIIRGVSFNR